MHHVDVPLDDHDFAQATRQALEAGLSLEGWVRGLIRHATVSSYPSDPLFGLLADAPDLADALDEVVAKRATRGLHE